MRRTRVGCLFCIAVFFAVAAFFPLMDVRAEETTKIDFAATLKYVQSWAARDSFPDSPSLAYQNVYCKLALEGQLADADRDAIVAFLAKCQRPDGGFVSSPDLKEGSNVIFTYFALAALDRSKIDRDKAVGFILSLVQKDGGIKASAREATANLGTTGYGVRSLYLLKALDHLDKDHTIAYIKSHHDDEKGFGVLPGKHSAPQPTFAAMDSLRLLGGLTDDIKTGVIAYIKETPYSRLKEPDNLALMSMDNMAYMLETASILSALQQLNTEKIYDFVQSLYIPSNGGFGPSPNLGSTPPSTYYAVECLVKLGKLNDPIRGE